MFVTVTLAISSNAQYSRTKVTSIFKHLHAFTDPFKNESTLVTLYSSLAGKLARLTITEAFPEDDGEYKCMASNTAGQSTAVGDLRVTRKLTFL